MKFNHKFRGLKRSEELESFLEERFEKLEKFEMKPIAITATYSVERHSCTVSIQISGQEIQMRASATEAAFLDAIEKVTQRCVRQLSRKKAKVQNHKCYERTKLSRLERLMADEESEAA